MAQVLFPGNDKIKLQKRISGDNLQFVIEAEKLSKYKCISCDKLALYNYTAPCQHLYCNKCHGKVSGKLCVVKGCSKTIGEDTKEKMKDQEIANLEVFCANSNAGCMKKIALQNYLKHVQTCKFDRRNLLPKLYPVNEFLEYKEKTNEEINKLREDNIALQTKIKQIEQQLSDHQNDKSIMEKVSTLSQSLEEDLSLMTKRFSLETELQKKATQNLREEIRKLVDDKIGDVIERQAVKQTVQEQKMKNFHSDISQEMSKMQEKLIKSEQTTTQLVDETIKSQMKGQKVEQQPTPTEFVWTISGIRQIVKGWKDGVRKEILSDTFVAQDYGYTMQCKLVHDSKMKSFNLLFSFHPDIPRSAPAVYPHQRSFSILDQSRFGEKHVWRLDTPAFGNVQARTWMSGYHNDSWMVPLELLGAKSPYVQNDCITAKILIEPLALVYRSVFARNGTLLWKLDSYSQRKQDYIDGVIKVLRSPCFYTHEQGYRVHLGLHMRNYDVSFYLSFNKGEFDDHLPPTFPHQATLTIMTQTGQHEHKSLIHTQKSSDTTSNLVAMIPTKDIERPEYLQDDSILIKLIVDK